MDARLWPAGAYIREWIDVSKKLHCAADTAANVNLDLFDLKLSNNCDIIDCCLLNVNDNVNFNLNLNTEHDVNDTGNSQDVDLATTRPAERVESALVLSECSGFVIKY